MAELTRITNADMVGHKVEELADVPNISTTALKRRFDSLTTDVVVPKFNELAESLEAWDIDHRVSSEAITNIKMDEDDNIVVSKDGGETYEKSNSSGHKIMNGAGIVFPAENRLQFSDNVVIIDDPENRKTFLSIPSGIKGDKGDAATIKVGTVEQGEEASIENVGSEQDAIFDFTLPKGDKGDAATVTVGVTTTGEAGSQAQVTNSGTQQAATFNFVIPKGDKGDPGTGLTLKDTYETLADLQVAHPTGSVGDAYLVGDSIENTVYLWSATTHAWENVGQLKGEQGEHGLAGSIQFGTIEGVAQGSEYVQNVGTPQNAILNMGLPIGDKGDKGDAATISIGTVTKGTEARVTNSGTSTNAVFNFVLPKGDQGEQGNPSVVNGKSGNSIILYGTDIVVSEEDNTPLSEMTGGGKAYTTEEWEDLDHDDIADGTQIIITDDYSSTICNTVEECEASESVDDVAGASALKELANRGEVYSTSEQVIGTYLGKPLYRSYFEVSKSGAGNFTIDITSNIPTNAENIHFNPASYVYVGTSGSFPVNSRWSGIYYSSNAYGLAINWASSTATYTVKIWIEYTKTTD